jgi:hypothetical protein
MGEKTKQARIMETVTILKKLQEIGIPATDSGYGEVKTHMSKWVHDGEAATVVIRMVRFGREAHLTLPDTDTKVAGLRLTTISE